ncbi:serine protease [Radiobacillus deserti]|uniref:Serine protease n=1 Tax=Radiobacillus deserti TaxID=2594883 RepID=A0A516KID5_9BACI|nr:serine protease [Radiobacillus deserti]
MNIHEIEEEMNSLKSRLSYLENCINRIQQNCNHHFKGNQLYEVCSKCKKVNVLYY